MEPTGPQTASSNRQLKPLPRRRQSVRQRVHSPAYASLNGTSDDMVLDLSEVLDISEQGAAIQTSSTWSANRVVNLCLDLSETETYLQTSGQIIWADRKGRIGVRFREMPADSRRKLQEWLFLNAMVGAANYVARHGEPKSNIDRWNAAPQPRPSAAVVEDTRADYTSTLAALAAVQREVEAHGANLTGALQLIAERCCTFTRANGAAIALLENGAMLCRASSGDAPPVGATLEIGSGFSGYCARTGFLQRCDDTEMDPRVDRESCRMLGVRSIIAVPIRMGNSVVGLLEVFSSKPRAFNERDGTILQRLADTVLAANNRATRARLASAAPQPRVTPPKRTSQNSITLPPPSNEPMKSYPFSSALEEPEEGPGFRFPQRHLVLLLVAASSIVMVLGYLLAPWVAERFHPRRENTVEAARPPVVTAAAPSPSTSGRPLNLSEVRKRAELGDPYEQVSLATRYATGEDVPQDYSAALRWFLKAAEQGHVGAQDTLGAYYYLGRGAPKDITRAYFWSVLARAAGKSASKDRVAFMSSQLTRAQAQAIQREANSFLKQHPPLMSSDSSY